MTVSTQAHGTGPALTSELAQFCLPAAHRDRNQRLAWMDSLCLVYLVIGVVGLKPPIPVVKQVVPIEEPVIQVIEQVQQEVQPADIKPEEPQEPQEDASDAPVVVVTLETPSTEFSVPTVGNVLGSASMAAAPPLNPMSAPVQTVKSNQIVRLGMTGRSGARPQPDYPSWAQTGNMVGTVKLLITVDTTGAITDVEVLNSTGHPRLDAHTVSHVKRRFSMSPEEGGKQYTLEVAYLVK